MNSQWKIRLLGDELQGREIWLIDGHLSLGEQGCDVCIPFIGKEKITLTEKEGELFVDVGNAHVRINGRKHRQDMPLPASGVLQTTGVTLAFGDSNSDLANYRIPTRFPWYWLLVGIALLLISLGGGFLNAVRESHPVTGLSRRVKQLLQQKGLAQIQANWAQDGNLQLSGYCQSSQQMQKIKMELETWGVMYKDNTICTNQLVNDVEDILEQAGYSHARVISQTPGSVLIRADIEMDQRWHTVQRRLSELPGLQHWQIESLNRSQSKLVINAIVHSELAGLVSVTPMEQSFVISGILDQSHQRLLQQTLTTLREQNPLLALTYQQVMTSDEGKEYLPAPVAGLVQGRRGSYLILTNGEHLQVGSHLPEGGEIVTLTPHAVAIIHHDSLINLPLNF